MKTTPGEYELRLTSRCNLHCVFCDRAAGDTQLPERDALRQARLAADAGVSAIALTGGEPTLHPRFRSLLASLHSLEGVNISIRTNALTFAYDHFLHSIEDKKTCLVELLVPAAERDAYERLTRAPGAHEIFMKAVGNLLRAGVGIRPRVPISESTLPYLADTLLFCAERFADAGEILLTLPRSLDAAERVAPGDLADVLKMVMSLNLHVPIALAPRSVQQLCLMGDLPAVVPLLRHNLRITDTADAPTLSTQPACAPCLIRAYCPAHAFAEAGVENAAPVSSVPARDSVERLVSDMLMPFRAADNVCTIGYARGADGKPVPNEALIRINYHCNQRCVFCWVHPSFRDTNARDVRRHIAEAAEAGVACIALTGGEPTLNPRLPEYIRDAASRGVAVLVQTNAVRLAEPGAAVRLASAGPFRALVSLHSHLADISDAITRAPGSFAKTLSGIRNLQNAGVTVLLMHVINRLNYRYLPDFVRFLKSENLEAASVTFALASPIFKAGMTREIVPRIEEFAPFLANALDTSEEAGVPINNLYGECGVPPCALPGHLRFFKGMYSVKDARTTGDFVKPPECAACQLNTLCFGYRRYYADLYGPLSPQPLTDIPVAVIVNMTSGGQ